MAELLIVDTATTVMIGPFLDKTDGVTPETGLAGAMVIYLSKNGGAFTTRSSAGAIAHDRDGYYRVPVDTDDIDTLGRLRLEVTVAGTHLPVWEIYRVVTSSEYTAASGASGTLYVSAAQVQAFKINGKVVELSAYSTSEIEDDINLASRFIESICNDFFYTDAARTQVYDGNGLTELFFFPEITARCISVSSITELDDDGSTVLDTFVEDTDFKLYDHYLGMLKSVDQRPRLRIQSRGVWPQGEQNISVTGSFGRSSVPAEIQRAAILLTLERLKPGSTKMAPQDVAQAVWPDFTITFKASIESGSTTGYNEVDRLLMPHVNTVDMFMAVPDERQYFDVSPFRKQ